MVRARRAGDDPRLGQLQPGDARHRRLLHRRRHDRLHAADRRATCSADFPTLRFIIPHGGGAVPYHWGRYRGPRRHAQAARRSTAHLMNNVFFDTCVYHQPGIDLLAEVIETKNILFGIGDGRRGARDRSADRPLFRRHQALHRRACRSATHEKHAIFEGNARRVYPAARRDPEGARLVSETETPVTSHGIGQLREAGALHPAARQPLGPQVRHQLRRRRRHGLVPVLGHRERGDDRAPRRHRHHAHHRRPGE